MLQTMNFPAGGRQIDAKANFFRYESCSANGADESVRVKADGNDLGLFLPGDYVQLPIYATRWEVVPVTGTASGTVRLGTGSVGSSRLTGIVRVVDQSVEKTRALKQFTTSPGRGANVAAISVVSIVPNGAVVSIKKITISSSTPGLVLLSRGSGIGTTQQNINSSNNKLINSFQSLSRVYDGIALTYPFSGTETPGFAYFGQMYVPANSPIDFPMTTPIVLDGSAGGPVLMVSPGGVNRDINTTFDIEEL